MKDKYKTIFDAKCFTIDEIINMKNNIELKNGYSIDHFELNTCKEDKTVNSNKTYDISVLVPVYNNGKSLYSKSFFSIKRSSVFEKIEIILVDYASTDVDTLAILNRLNREYENVKICRYEVDEDKSINKELQKATGKYITFLDSYNESTNDGYKKLYDLITKRNYKVIRGKYISIDYNQENEEANPQSMIIKKEFLLNNTNPINLNNINQENISFNKSLLFTKMYVKHINDILYIYYSKV